MREKMSPQQANRSLTAKERENWGLNPHRGARTDRLYDLADESKEANPEASVCLEDIRMLIEKAKKEYPENHNIQFVWGYYYEGRPIAEVAYKMGVGTETAKTRLARTAKFIGEYIQAQEEE